MAQQRKARTTKTTQKRKTAVQEERNRAKAAANTQRVADQKKKVQKANRELKGEVGSAASRDKLAVAEGQKKSKSQLQGLIKKGGKRASTTTTTTTIPKKKKRKN